MSEAAEPEMRSAESMPRQEQQSAPPSDLSADDDPRIVQMLSTEHWSVLSARSLAYNEAFTRAGMFLSFLSMSTVALGLLAQGTGFGRDFRTIAAVVLGFDLLIGLSTYLRISGAGYDDLVALHGMSRIRHAYTEIAPSLRRYFTSPFNDDIDSVMRAYPSIFGHSKLGELPYVLSTTGGMIGLIVSAIGGIFAGVVASLFISSGDLALLVGAAGALLLFTVLALLTYKAAYAAHAGLPVLFPAEDDGP
jgi:hypothetical protein